MLDSPDAATLPSQSLHDPLLGFTIESGRCNLRTFLKSVRDCVDYSRLVNLSMHNVNFGCCVICLGIHCSMWWVG